MRTTPSGERYIQITDITTCGTGGVKPLGETNRALLDRLMDGLYVRAWGEVKSVSQAGHWYVISDGSDATGIKIITPGEPTVSLGDYARVSGAAGWDAAECCTPSRWDE